MALTVSKAAAQNQIGTVFLNSGGLLDGQTVDSTNQWITVLPNEAITGTVNVQTDNFLPSDAVAPLGYTATWGDRTTQPVLINGWIATGVQNYGFSVNETAPEMPGTYYLPIAFSGEFTIQEVMSATNWTVSSGPVWNDGNDVGWDWTAPNTRRMLLRATSLNPTFSLMAIKSRSFLPIGLG